MSDVQGKIIRSPSYPAVPLGDAISAIRKIESKYRSAPIDRVDAARLMGFSSLSGPANQALAALASYGLVERAGKGEIRVTLRAKAILHPNSDREKKEHLIAAGCEPQLYRELRERFADVSSPPEEGVVSYLNRQGFNQNSIRSAAKAFLSTISYLEEAGATESHSGEVILDRESASDGGSRNLVRHHEGQADPSPVTYELAPARSGVQLMSGERIVFVEESSPAQYLKLVATGDLNLDMLEALEDYVKRQKRRILKNKSISEGDNNE